MAALTPAGPHPAPPPDSWTVAIFHGEHAPSPAGTGFVVEPTRILTAAHVVKANGEWRTDLWVTFPKVEDLPDGRRYRIVRCCPDAPPRADVALIELEEPVPALVTPVRLRLPRAADLHGDRWWAFGFPDGVPDGDAARGHLDIALANGKIKLRADDDSRLTKGYSGAAIWSTQYQAAVGLVLDTGYGDGLEGSGQAMTLFSADRMLPELKIGLAALWTPEDVDEPTLAAWGWSLRTDPELGAHWSPRARGVPVGSHRGFHFRGRGQALTEIKEWLADPRPTRRVLIVTGSPGVGKSAVLGRIVTTADPAIAGQHPDDGAVRADLGSISCAVHAKGRTALDVAQEVARAASAPIPSTVDGWVPQLLQRLAERPHATPFNLVVDALDEAITPAEARRIAEAVIVPLARASAASNVRVLVGTRRRDNGGELLAPFDGVGRVLDLDDEAYFEADDLVAYALSSLQLRGAERAGNPYADIAVAQPVARRIAELAQRNFLVAGLVARMHGTFDATPVSSTDVWLTGTVDQALDSYVAGLPAVNGMHPRRALLVLAYAEGPGLTPTLWQAGLAALGEAATVDELRAFAGSATANFLIETGAGNGEPSYRLFHQALNDALLRSRHNATVDQSCLFDAWLAYGRRIGWADAPEYLRVWLPAHAEKCGRVDDLLADDEYLPYADPRRLLMAAETAKTDRGRARARLLRRTPAAFDQPPLDRAAMLSVTAALDHTGRLATPAAAPYRGLWANTPRRPEVAVLAGHTQSVLAVCSVMVGDRTLLASAGEDRSIRLWDPFTGQTEHVLTGHTDRVRDLCALELNGRGVVVSAGDDATIRLWEPGSGVELTCLRGHTGWVRALCVVTVDDQVWLASGSDDRTVRLWDPVAGAEIGVLYGHISWVTALTALADGELAAGTYDGSITVWNANTGSVVRELREHTSWITGLTAVAVDGRTLLASAGYDRRVRLWDADDDAVRSCWVEAPRILTDLSTVRVDGRDVLASAAEDGRIRLRDAGTGELLRELAGPHSFPTDVCGVTIGNRSLLASASADGTVRLWDPATGETDIVLDGGRIGAVTGLAGLTMAGQPSLAATSEAGELRLWAADSGELVRSLPGRVRLTDVCNSTVDNESVLVAAGEDGAITVWDATTGRAVRRLAGHADSAVAIAPIEVRGRPLLASVGVNHTVRLWNLASGELERELQGHTAWVRAIGVLELAVGPLLVSGSHDGSAKVWQPATGECVRTLNGHQGAVNAVCAVPLDGEVALATGDASGRIRLWHPLTGRPLSTMDGHLGEVRGLAVTWLDGRPVLASASLDRTVRLWELATGAPLAVIPVDHGALACHHADGRLFVGLHEGVLALALRGGFEGGAN